MIEPSKELLQEWVDHYRKSRDEILDLFIATRDNFDGSDYQQGKKRRLAMCFSIAGDGGHGRIQSERANV